MVMSESISLTAKVKLKTNRIHGNCMCLVKDRKVHKIFIAHEKGVHIYDDYQQQFEEVRVSETGGIVSCLTSSSFDLT